MRQKYSDCRIKSRIKRAEFYCLMYGNEGKVITHFPILFQNRPKIAVRRNKRETLFSEFVRFYFGDNFYFA